MVITLIELGSGLLITLKLNVTWYSMVLSGYIITSENDLVYIWYYQLAIDKSSEKNSEFGWT